MSENNYHINQVDQLPDEVENLIHQGHVQDEAENLHLIPKTSKLPI